MCFLNVVRKHRNVRDCQTVEFVIVAVVENEAITVSFIVFNFSSFIHDKPSLDFAAHVYFYPAGPKDAHRPSLYCTLA